MDADKVFLILVVVAASVAVAARRFKVPYTAALVVAGLVLGSLEILNPPHLTRELLFAVFLPGLLFEAAFHIEFRAFWRDRWTILGLAVPGVIAAITLTTLIISRLFGVFGLVGGIDWRYALLFSAVVAATDPVAVVGLFKKLNAPPRLTMLLEGESLLNDGTAIVFFSLVLDVVSGRPWSASSIAVGFVTVIGAGVLVGSVFGAGISLALRRIDDPMIEITLTTIAAYGSFVAAEQFHSSGVIASVVAGMICGNWGVRTGMAPSTRVAAEVFWEYIAFALNSVVFLLIGFEVPLAALLESWREILLAYLAVSVVRGGIILAISAIRRRTADPLPRSWAVVLTWGGLRGALSMVLALSLPAFPQRGLLVTMTFGVVLITIIVQGLSMSPLLQWLRIVQVPEAQIEYERLRGRLQATSAALDEIEEMKRARLTSREVIETLEQEYQTAADAAAERIHDLHMAGSVLRQDELRGARRHLILAEKNYLLEARSQGALGRPAYDQLLADVDARLLKVDSGDVPGERKPGPRNPSAEEKSQKA